MYLFLFIYLFIYVATSICNKHSVICHVDYLGESLIPKKVDYKLFSKVNNRLSKKHREILASNLWHNIRYN